MEGCKRQFKGDGEFDIATVKRRKKNVFSFRFQIYKIYTKLITINIMLVHVPGLLGLLVAVVNLGVGSCPSGPFASRTQMYLEVNQKLKRMLENVAPTQDFNS